MEKKENGISMISLIVVIISIIILSALAINAAYRYIAEGQRAEKTTLTNLILEAARRRQEDYFVGLQTSYEGYAVTNPNIITTDNFKNLPEDWEAEKEKITKELNGVAPAWYVLDGESVTKLGVQEIARYEDLITSNLSTVTGTDYIPVALVEYVTGNTYLVEMKQTLISELAKVVQE